MKISSNVKFKLVALLATSTLMISGCSASFFEENVNDGALNEITDGEDCTRVNIYASSEKAEILSNAAVSFNASETNSDDLETCSRIGVYTKASGLMLDNLPSWDEEVNGPTPTVWTPASSSWLKLLEVRSDETILEDSSGSIANSPLVIAMPKPMAESLGWPDAELGWSDILNLSLNQEGWGSVGHPEWGAFKLGKTNPNFSTSGLNATVGSYFAATGLSSDLSSNDVNDEKVREYIHSIESSVVHYGDTTLTFLSSLLEADDKGLGLSYISAVTVEEKSVWDYNKGNPTGNPTTLGQHAPPKVPLVSIYPKEGTLISDNPYSILTSATPEQKEAANAFLTYLQTPEIQNVFKASGFRDFENNAGSSLEDDAFNTENPVTLNAPSSNVLNDILISWKEERKSARVLLVVDVSGSMSGSRIELARQALNASLDGFAEHDQVGLAEFSDSFKLIEPVQTLTPDHKKVLTQEINGLRDGGSTSLFSSISKSVEMMQELPNEQTINAVVVLSDGENREPGSIDDVLKHFNSTESDDLKLFTIAYGSEADTESLTLMARTSGGFNYDASDTENIKNVVSSVISNF